MSGWAELDPTVLSLEIAEGEACRVELTEHGWRPTFACGQPFPCLPRGIESQKHALCFAELALAERYRRLADQLETRAKGRTEWNDLKNITRFWGLF